MYNLSTAADVAAFVRMAEANKRARVAREAREARREFFAGLFGFIGVIAFAFLCVFFKGHIKIFIEGGEFSIINFFIDAIAGGFIGAFIGWSAAYIMCEGVGFWYRVLKGQNHLVGFILFLIACVAIFGFFAKLGIPISIAGTVLGFFWLINGGKNSWIYTIITVAILAGVLSWAIPKYIPTYLTPVKTEKSVTK